MGDGGVDHGVKLWFGGEYQARNDFVGRDAVERTQVHRQTERVRWSSVMKTEHFGYSAPVFNSLSLPTSLYHITHTRSSV